MNLDVLLRRMAICLVLLVPVFLFYGRAVADALICVIDVLFLVRSTRAADFTWVRQPWVVLAGTLWALQLIASIRLGPVENVLQGAVMIRLLVFLVALQAWVLQSPRARRALWAVFALLAVWTASQCWEQLLTGVNATGSLRWLDGALTGPFYKPRAGEVFLFVSLPGIMPLVLWLLGKTSKAARGGGVIMLLFMLVTMILIGQRMPNLLMVLGLIITALMVKRLRLPLIIALATGGIVIALLPIVSPPTFTKLVLVFGRQISHFAASPYGQLYTRASVMIASRPLSGFGFDGFKDYCGIPRFFHGWPALGIPDDVNGADKACNLHPHNYYFQIGVMAGLPGLALFITLAVLWLIQMAKNLRPSQDAIRAMVFVTACVILWPIASTSSMFTLDTAGWVFLMIGWGLAASRNSERVPLGQRVKNFSENESAAPI